MAAPLVVSNAVLALRRAALRFAAPNWGAYLKAANGDPGLAGRLLQEIGRAGQYQFPDLQQYSHQIDMYANSPWVHVGVGVKAKAFAEIELNVKQLKGEKQIDAVNHPIEQLLRKPNAWQSQSELLEATAGYLALTGNCYWYLDGAPGQPSEIIIMRPDRVRIVAAPDTRTYVRGYVYMVDGVEIPIPPNEVIHFKHWHPGNDFYGLSDMQAAMISIVTDLNASKWQAGFFGKENAIPSGIVTLPSTLSDLDYDRVVDDWLRNYGSGQRKTAFIRGGAVGYNTTGISQREMDFIQGRKADKELIMLVFRVPPGMLDANATEANANAGYEFFTSQVLWPQARAFAQKLSAELCPLWGDGLIIEPTDFRAQDKSALLDEVKAVQPFFRINEIRTKYFHAEEIDEEWAKIPASGAGAVLASGQPVGKADALPKPDEFPAQDRGGVGLAKAIEAANFFKTIYPTLPANPPPATLKSAPGADTYVLLSFADDPSIIAVQNQLKAQYPDVRWSDTGSFHITLVYAKNAVDIDPIKAVLPTGINPFTVDVSGVDVFDGPEGVVIYLAIQPPAELLALQSGLAASFESLGLTLSDYSDPANWKPHITLGYAPVGSEIPAYDGNFSLTSNVLQCSVANGDDFQVIYETKAITEIPRVQLTRKMREELAQFGRYVVKGKGVDRFTFKFAPKGVALAAKAWADTIEDIHDFSLTAKAVIPAGQRVSLDGKADPLAKQKAKAERAMQSDVSVYLSALQQRVIAAVKFVNRSTKTSLIDDVQRFLTYLDKQFFQDDLDKLNAVMKPLLTDAFESGAMDTADALQLSTGIDFDPSRFSIEAADYAATWTDTVLANFGTTNQSGVGALLSRWVGTPGGTLEDLISAIQESYLFSSDRAALIATTEITRTFAAATYSGAQAIADSAGVDMAVAYGDVVDGGPPLHPDCYCWLTPKLIYNDKDEIIGVDFIWQTNNADNVCQRCAPRNGKLLSEVFDAA